MGVSRLSATLIGVIHVAAVATTNELRLNSARSPRPFNLSATLRTDSTLHRLDSVDRQSQGRLTLTPSLALNESYRSAVSLTVIQDFKNDRKTIFANTNWTVSRKPLRLSNDTSMAPAAGVRLPTNVEDRKHNTYNVSLFIDSVIVTSWNFQDYPVQSLYGLSVLKNMHDYDRNSQGQANIDHALTHSMGLELPLFRNFALSLEGDYTYARTYQGSPRSLFSLTESLTWSGRGLRLAVGHSNAGQVFQANGTDYNIRVFDENQSIVFLLLNVSDLGGNL